MARMKLPCARAISHPWGRATSTSPSHSRRAVSSSPLAISRNFAVVLTSDSALRGGVTASRAGSSRWFTSLAGQLSLSTMHRRRKERLLVPEQPLVGMLGEVLEHLRHRDEGPATRRGPSRAC